MSWDYHSHSHFPLEMKEAFSEYPWCQTLVSWCHGWRHHFSELALPGQWAWRCIIHVHTGIHAGCGAWDKACWESGLITVIYPACGAEHLEVQRVSGELALYLGQWVAGGHARHERWAHQTLLGCFGLWRREAATEGEDLTQQFDWLWHKQNPV